VTPFLCVPYGYHSEQIELISFSTLQLENDIPTLSVSQVSSPTIIVERAGSYAWTHKSWRVREEFVRTVATAVGLFASTEISLQRVLLSPVSQHFQMVAVYSFYSYPNLYPSVCYTLTLYPETLRFSVWCRSCN